tara:strand:- start:26223 stop:26816 length:594 start_codon:yes stop_codon:yes gene_type:complete
MSLFVFNLFLAFEIFLSILTVVCFNPIYSLLFLILLFFMAAIFLLTIKVEFFALLLIIVYVGAVAILFLFVIIMLKIKLRKSFFSPLFIVFLSFLCLTSIGLYIVFNTYFYILSYQFSIETFTDFNFCYFDKIKTLTVIGQFFYNYFIIILLIAGFILLIALMGAIVLTLDFSTKKFKDMSYRQLSRKSLILEFFNE